ncbi:MAG TPA: hypothetical protein VKF42_05990 [Chitinivibrionales bacterium]|jgi:hypothetical protein|nr:hypothetical protein [Chitinivibrionales bacterium]
MEKHLFDKVDLLAYAAGDAAEAKRACIERHLAGCEQCRAFLSSMESEKAAFLAEHPFEQAVAVPARQPRAQRFFFVRRQAYALAATLVLCATVGYLYLSGGTARGSRIKGDTSLTILVKDRHGDIEKRAGREYFTGEKIQFVYSCGADNHFALIGIDTADGVTTYFPPSGDSSMVLDKGRDIPLPNSIALDNYTGPELFAGVFSDRRFSLSDVRRRIGSSLDKSSLPDTLRLGGGFVTVSHLLTIKQGTP